MCKFFKTPLVGLPAPPALPARCAGGRGPAPVPGRAFPARMPRGAARSFASADPSPVGAASSRAGAGWKPAPRRERASPRRCPAVSGPGAAPPAPRGIPSAPFRTRPAGAGRRRTRTGAGAGDGPSCLRALRHGSLPPYTRTFPRGRGFQPRRGRLEAGPTAGNGVARAGAGAGVGPSCLRALRRFPWLGAPRPCVRAARPAGKGGAR